MGAPEVAAPGSALLLLAVAQLCCGALAQLIAFQQTRLSHALQRACLSPGGKVPLYPDDKPFRTAAIRGLLSSRRSLPYPVSIHGREEGVMRRRFLPLAVLGAILALTATLTAGASAPRVIMSEEFGYPS